MSEQNDPNAPVAQLVKACEGAQGLLTGYIEAVNKSNAAALKGFEELTRNMSGLMQESYARAVSAAKILMTAKTPQEAAESHAEYMKDCYDGMVSSSGKISEISLQAAKGAIDPLAQHANEAIGTMTGNKK